MNKLIKYYRISQYGVTREFIHPDNNGEKAIIRQLTGQKTINSVVRELIRNLTGGTIQFTEIIQPLIGVEPSKTGHVHLDPNY